MPRLPSSLPRVFAAGGLACALGCGAILSGEDPGPPLAQLHGTVSDATATPLGAPYVELLWTSPMFFEDDAIPIIIDLGVESGHTLVPITTQFPSGFTLNLYGPPPDSLFATLDLDDGEVSEKDVDSGKKLLRLSLATVVVFDDVNRDADFDLLDPNGRRSSAFYKGSTFAPDLLRGWLDHGAVIYVASLPDLDDPNVAKVFANPHALQLGFQTLTQCHLPGTAEDTRYQVIPASEPLSLHLVEPLTAAPPESQPLWFDDAATLPDCVP